MIVEVWILPEKKKNMVWNGRFPYACCIAVHVPSGKPREGLVYVKIILIRLFEKICSHWSTIIFRRGKLSRSGIDLSAKMWNIETSRFACKNRSCSLAVSVSFGLSLWCVMILMQLCLCVHGFNCAHLPAPPSLVQHQAKARAEPGSVWRVLSLPYPWAFSSTSGNNLSE